MKQLVTERGEDTTKSPATAPRRQATLQRAASAYATVALLVVLVIVFSITANNFATSRNWSSLLVSQAVTGMMALAALLPLIIGEFDLSLGYNLGFLAMLGAWLSGHHQSAFVVVVTVLVAGLLVGLINGVLSVRLRISSFIATLGVGTLAYGVTLGLSGGQVLYAGIPHFVMTIANKIVFGAAISVWLTLLIALICLYYLEHTPPGRRLYAIGGSERVAFIAGIRTHRLKILTFGLAGLLVGVGSLFQLGQAGAATPGFGPDLLLPAYAAAFLGVTTYRPGYYNVPGAIVAILLLAVGFNGLSLLGVPFWVQPLFNGVVLLAAVLFAHAERNDLAHR